MIKKTYLPSTFNHDECQSVYDSIAENITAGSDVVIVGSNVERIGTAGVQIILAAGALCQQNSKKCVIEEPSSALLESLEQLGCINFVKSMGMIP